MGKFCWANRWPNSMRCQPSIDLTVAIPHPSEIRSHFTCTGPLRDRIDAIAGGVGQVGFVSRQATAQLLGQGASAWACSIRARTAPASSASFVMSERLEQDQHLIGPEP